MAQAIKGSSCRDEGVINPECSLRARYSSVCLQFQCWGQRLASQLSSQWAPGLERRPACKNKMEIHQRLLSQQLPFACSSAARGRTSYSCLSSMLGFDVVSAYTGLVDAVSMAVSSCVQLPCCAPRTLFPCIHLLPLALRLFLSSSSSMAPETWKEGHTFKSTQVAQTGLDQ